MIERLLWSILWTTSSRLGSFKNFIGSTPPSNATDQHFRVTSCIHYNRHHSALSLLMQAYLITHGTSRLRLAAPSDYSRGYRGRRLPCRLYLVERYTLWHIRWDFELAYLLPIRKKSGNCVSLASYSSLIRESLKPQSFFLYFLHFILRLSIVCIGNRVQDSIYNAITRNTFDEFT